jgi:hypothetical protein
VLATLYTVTVDTRTTGPVTSLSQVHRLTGLCRCEVYNLPHARTVVLVHVRGGIQRVVRRPVAASHLFRVGSRCVRSVVARCSHQLYQCREGWRRAARVGGRGALVLAPWEGKCATGTGLVRRVAGA